MTPPPPVEISRQPTLHRNQLFAPLDADLHLERVAGGNESEVYCTDDRRYVVKVKPADSGAVAEAVATAHVMRRAAAGFAGMVGPEHTIPSYFIVSANARGNAQPVIIQPYYQEAVPLFAIDYAELDGPDRRHIARQLLRIVRRSLAAYLRTGRMPDIYGRTSASPAERARRNVWYKFPQRVWSFLIRRNLLRSHNLMVTAAPERRVILVDYDPVRRSRLYQFVYYNVRLVLFLRDVVLLAWLLLRNGRSRDDAA